MLSSTMGARTRNFDAAREVGERIRTALETRQMDQAELARRLGITKGNVTKWIEGKTSPQGDRLLRIADELGLSFLELPPTPPEPMDVLPGELREILGELKQVLARDAAGCMPRPEVATPIPSGGPSAEVRFVEGEAAAGVPPGTAERRHGHEVVFVPKQLVKDPHLARAVPVRGDSMAPLLADGSVVIVDCGAGQDEASLEGRICAASLPPTHAAVVKRLHFGGAAVSLISENRVHGDTVIERPHWPAWKVLGPVVCWRDPRGVTMALR